MSELLRSLIPVRWGSRIGNRTTDSFPTMEVHPKSILCLALFPFITCRNNESGSRFSQSPSLCSFPTRPTLYNEDHPISDYTDSPRVDGYTSPLYSDRPLYADPPMTSPMFSSSLPMFGDHSTGMYTDASAMYSDPSSAPLFPDSSSPLFTDHSPTASWTPIHPPVWPPRESFLPPTRPLFGSPFPPKRSESSPFSLKHTLSAGSSEFVPKKTDYSIDIEKVRRGEDKRTTLMVRNIPNG